jgi:2-amino-4-hydroxy-6-hydroxymethyldihydropteridine diphosphokinase
MNHDDVMRAYVGVGSNLGDSAGIVREAFSRLRRLGTNFVNSDLYVTKPWGVTDQPDFINAAAAFDTDMSATDLLAALRTIEAEFGRRRDERWGPRSLDLDLLVFGDDVIERADCTIPHPSLRDRAFVLEPLFEIAADAKIPPDGKSVGELRDVLPAEDRANVRRLANTADLTPPPRVDYDAPGGAGEQYDTLRPFSPFDTAVLNAVFDATGTLAGKRVLDIGCGTGRFTERLAQEGASVVGMDPSATMLAAARTRKSGGDHPIRYVEGDANESLPSGPFDAVTAFYCVQYIDVAGLAERVTERLSDGGVIALATFPHQHFALTEYGVFFPSLPAIDMARFPSVPAIESAFRSAYFVDLASKDVVLTIEDDPAALIGRVERKYLSSFFLLPEREFREGLAQMRRQWQGQAVVRRSARAVVVSGRFRTGSDR